MPIFTNCASLLALLCLLAPGARGAPDASPALPRTILFVDDEDVLYRAGTEKQIEPLEKYAKNPVLFPEKPWEGMIGWTSVYRNPDTGKFQMWYQAYNKKRQDDPRLVCVVAYAESKDGRKWVKPNLGLFPYYETKDTNIVLIGAPDSYSDRYCNSVLVDPRDPDPSRRYKMVYYDWAPGDDPEGAGMRIAYSPDGIHWNKVGGRTPSKTSYGAKGMQPPFAGESILYVETSAPGKRAKKSWLVPISMSDAQDVIYDHIKGCYASYGKMWMPGPDGGSHWKHGMGRIESKDFVTWTKPQFLLGPNDNDPPEVEFHTSPVFIYNNQYLSLNQILRRGAGTIDIELMSSRDGINWARDYSQNYILSRGAGPVFDSGSLLTNATPVDMGDEVWFYYGAYRGTAIGGVGLDKQVAGSSDYHSGVGLAIMKKDRFVSVRPDTGVRIVNSLKPLRETVGKEAPPIKPNTIGQVTLKPLDLTGIRLIKINANAKGGSVSVELLNERGYKIRGFSKEEAVAITKDGLALPASWRGSNLSKLKPGKYMIRIHLDNARLYGCTLE